MNRCSHPAGRGPVPAVVELAAAPPAAGTPDDVAVLADVPVVIVGVVDVWLPAVEALSPVPKNSSAVVRPPDRCSDAVDAAAADAAATSRCGRVHVVDRVV